MKTEVAVLSGKEPFGVRIELSVKEAEHIVVALTDDTHRRSDKMATELISVINSVKHLNTQQTNEKG